MQSLAFTDKRSFSHSEDTRITLLVRLYAVTGTRAKVVWCDGNGEPVREPDETEFKRENDYSHFPSLEIVELEDGDYSVEYYLRDIRWFKAKFKVKR